MPRSPGAVSGVILTAHLALAACSDFPDLDVPGLDGALRAPYPQLVPLEQALGPADAPLRFTPDEAAALKARAAALPGSVAAAGSADTAARLARLRARATALRGPLDSEDDIEAMRRRLAAL